MNTQRSSRWFWLALAAVCLTVPFFVNKTAANRTATQSQGGTATANVKTAGGLTVVTFTVNRGTITVNLPDDMRAGDTISGTVVEEPKGQTKEERAKNQAELNGLVIEIDGKRLEPFPVIAKERESTIQSIFYIYRPADPKPPTQPKTVTPTRVSLANQGGSDLAQATIPVWVFLPDPMTPSGAVITPDPKITVPTHPSGAVITPDPKITPTFIIPPLGQTGRPLVITGPFDGNSSNTSLNWTAVRSAGQDFEKDTENVSGGFGLLAESPRKAVFEAPSNVTGPIELHLTEGKTQTTGNYRNVGVNLTAPKTSLLKGESTELHVEVNGLQGLTQPVPLTLESHGVITMVGGNYQPLVIQPSQVGADGRYTTTRGITGVQTGGWTATATVVTHKFDICLQDDTAPARRILWSTFNGDYIFVCPTCWPPKGQQGRTGGTTGESGGTKTGGESGDTTPPADPHNPPGGLTGQGKMNMKGCIITLQHNAPDRRVFATLDSCTTSGSATIEDPKTKVKFTITDRNIADNTCQSQ